MNEFGQRKVPEKSRPDVRDRSHAIEVVGRVAEQHPPVAVAAHDAPLGQAAERTDTPRAGGRR